MANTTRARRECREPHTLFDSSCLEAHASPRLNDLSHRGHQGDNVDTTASTVLNRFSSVSPKQAGFSSDSIGGYFFPPPPPPFFFSSAATTTNPPGVEWPPPIPSPAWARPQDVPWIPPPPIPPNHPGTKYTSAGKDAGAARWPTPQDIPLPSTFPFPPYLLPPFPPGVDLSQIPPPPAPPWFPVPPGDRRKKRHGEEEEDEEDCEDEEDEDEESESVSEPEPQQWHGVNSKPTIRMREPSISAQERNHMRSIASEARRRLQHGVARSYKRGEEQWRQRMSRDASPACSTVRGVARAAPTSTRRFSSPSLAQYAVGTSRPIISTTKLTPQRRRDYYSEARALKGVTPQLGDAMVKSRAASRKVGLAKATSSDDRHQSRDRRRPKSSSTDVNFNNVGQSSALNVVSGCGKAAKGDERVVEYLKGIEDLYQRLRSSYEEFQRDPSSFMRSASSLKEAAVSKAPPVHTLLDKVDVIKKEQNGHGSEHGKSARKGLDLESEESRRLKNELLKLEMQWQRLEELKQGSTGERGAAPVEFVRDNATSLPLGQRNGEKETEGLTAGAARGRHVATSNPVFTADLQRASSLAGVTNGKTVSGATSRGSTPSSVTDQRRGRGTPKGSSTDGPFTREHVLGLVRERKAMLE